MSTIPWERIEAVVQPPKRHLDHCAECCTPLDPDADPHWDLDGETFCEDHCETCREENP